MPVGSGHAVGLAKRAAWTEEPTSPPDARRRARRLNVSADGSPGAVAALRVAGGGCREAGEVPNCGEADGG